MMISGFLPPNGEFVEVGYGNHGDWARDLVEAKGWDAEGPPINRLFKMGYLQISDGWGFFNAGGSTHMKLTGKQMEWLIESGEQLSHHTRQFLVDIYDLAIPGIEPNKPRADLIEPSFDNLIKDRS